MKARLLDQHAIAGVGNLLADETLWQAAVAPERPADELDADEVARLHRELRKAIRHAITKGGVHTGEVIAAPQRRRPLPALRRADAAYGRRRPHHLGVLGRAGRLSPNNVIRCGRPGDQNV